MLVWVSPRPPRQDAIAEIHYLACQPRNYHWVLEADIAACFDTIDHAALLERLRVRIIDKRVYGLVKAFLKAGVMTTTGEREPTLTGTPQGGIFVPAAGQHRAVGAGRSLRPAVAAADGNRLPAGQTQAGRLGELAPCPLRRRLCATNVEGGFGVEDELSGCGVVLVMEVWPSGIALQGEVSNHRVLLR